MLSLYLYANIDQFDATKYELEYDKLSVMDKWLLSKIEYDGQDGRYKPRKLPYSGSGKRTSGICR